jgi:hypothetical protein
VWPLTVRCLRIAHLAFLGIPLSHIGPVSMIKHFPMQHQPVDPPNDRTTYVTGDGMPRRISVNACQREVATIVVTVVHGTVWMSIVPPFTWEAIMEPGMVDEVIRVLELARDDAKRMAEAARGRRPGPTGRTVVPEIERGATGPRARPEMHRRTSCDDEDRER